MAWAKEAANEPDGEPANGSLLFVLLLLRRVSGTSGASSLPHAVSKDCELCVSCGPSVDGCDDDVVDLKSSWWNRSFSGPVTEVRSVCFTRVCVLWIDIAQHGRGVLM